MSVGLRQAVVILFVAAWGLACGWGLLAIHGHQSAPGRGGRDAGRWPAGTALGLEPRGYTLLLFAHPRCPCLKATLRELARVIGFASRPPSGGTADGEVSRPPLPARVQIVAFAPGPSPIAEDPGWSRAMAALEGWTAWIPSSRVVRDVGGAEARRFGAATSGDIILFDPGGRILFRGGITRGRGLEGESVAARRLLAILRGDPARNQGASCRSAVYGCPILPQEPPGPN